MDDAARSQTTLPSDKAQDLFDQTRLRTLGLSAAQRLWERHLNSTQKRMLGASLHDALDTYPNAYRMWARVKSVNLSLAVIEVAEALNLLSTEDAEWLKREGGELPRDPEEAELVAIERGDLVLNCREHRFYWNGREYEVGLSDHPVLWDFLLTVCQHAKRGESVGWDSFGDGKRENYVTQTKSQLSMLDGFPQDVIELFESDGPKRQRLNLPADRIHIFY